MEFIATLEYSKLIIVYDELAKYNSFNAVAS